MSYRLQDMCGPCQRTGKAECVSQPGGRLTIACVTCKAGKKPCNTPHASWARPILAAMRSRGMSASHMHSYLLTMFCQDTSAGPSAGGGELLHRMDMVEYKLDRLFLILNALCEEKNINTAAIPGMDKPPPVRRSLSPSVQSTAASSPQLGMASLNISDSRSNASSASDRPGTSLCVLSHM